MATDALIIVGTGLAGYHLAKEFRKQDIRTPVCMVTEDNGDFYSKPMLSNAFSKQKDPAQLVMQSAETLASQLNATVLTHTQVLALNANTKTLTTTQGDLSYARLVLACGATPIRLPFPGHMHLLSINHLEDYKNFRAKLDILNTSNKGPLRLIILGAGLIGCEFANDLQREDIQVTLIDQANQCMPRLLPKPMGDALQKKLETLGVQCCLNTSITRITGEFGAYVVEDSQGRIHEAHCVLSAIGLRPNTDWLKTTSLSLTPAISVDGFLKTTVDSIYALGDCAEVNGQWQCYVMALMNSARALAKTLSGTPTELSNDALPVVVKTPACPLVICPAPARSNGQWVISKENTEGLFYDSAGILRGFALMDETTQMKNNWLQRIGKSSV